jgi:hypothetical protein
MTFCLIMGPTQWDQATINQILEIMSQDKSFPLMFSSGDRKLANTTLMKSRENDH